MIEICFIITSLETGGAETWLYRLLERIDRSRFTVRVISLTNEGTIGPRIEALGIPVIALGMTPGLAAILRLPRIVRTLRAIQPDIVHTLMYHADLLGGIASKLAGVPRIVWGIRHADLSPEHNKARTLAVVRVCTLLSSWIPERIISCSVRACDLHAAAGYRVDKIVVIPNGYDLDAFAPDDAARRSVRTELGLGADTPLVGLIARHDPLKNHVGFLAAAARVRKAIPDVHFVLAGQGVDVGNHVLTAMIAEQTLEGAVHLLGQREDIPRLTAAFDVAALASHGEAFPNVLGEAMACAVPCVSTDAGDAAEIIGKTGIVVHTGDMTALADGLVSILQLAPEDRQALGRAARARVMQRFAINDVVRRYEAALSAPAVGEA